MAAKPPLSPHSLNRNRGQQDRCGIFTVETLLKGTTAYKILAGDRAQGRLSHAYMLHFLDSANLKTACTLFAAEMYGADEGVRRRIQGGNFLDVIFYPKTDKGLRAEDADEIVDDCIVSPAEGDKKIYVLCPFNIDSGMASQTVQNRLLKSLEEPPNGVMFLLGVTSMAPVLPTVLSRVKKLEIPPFSEGEIRAYLKRAGFEKGAAVAASACGGIPSVALEMARGARFIEIDAAAREICITGDRNIGAVCAKYGEFKYKNELLGRMQSLIFAALTGKKEGEEIAARRSKQTLISASEWINSAAADVKFNAQFSALLYDFCLRFNEEDSKWKRLSE